MARGTLKPFRVRFIEPLTSKVSASLYYVLAGDMREARMLATQINPGISDIQEIKKIEVPNDL